MRKFFNIKLLTPVFILLILPFLTSAQLADTTKFFENAYRLIKNILVPLTFTLAVLVFFWGIVKYIWSVGAEKEKGKQIMIWGVIALFVMSSIWGIVYFIGQQLGGDIGGENIEMYVPTIKTQ